MAVEREKKTATIWPASFKPPFSALPRMVMFLDMYVWRSGKIMARILFVGEPTHTLPSLYLNMIPLMI